jgi:hypothetical protein
VQRKESVEMLQRIEELALLLGRPRHRLLVMYIARIKLSSAEILIHLSQLSKIWRLTTQPITAAGFLSAMPSERCLRLCCKPAGITTPILFLGSKKPCEFRF